MVTSLGLFIGRVNWISWGRDADLWITKVSHMHLYFHTSIFYPPDTFLWVLYLAGWGQHPLNREMECRGAQTEREILGDAFCCVVFHACDCFHCDSVTSGLTLLRSPHWALSHRSWDRHSSEFKGASMHQQQNCRFNERQGASWLQGTLPTTSRTQKIHLTYLQVHCNPVASQVNLFCTFWMKRCFTHCAFAFLLRLHNMIMHEQRFNNCLTKE